MIYVLNGELMTDILFESQMLYEALAISDMECERTIRRSEHGLDPIDANTICSICVCFSVNKMLRIM